jgi:hypothetical protein
MRPALKVEALTGDLHQQGLAPVLVVVKNGKESGYLYGIPRLVRLRRERRDKKGSQILHG